MLKLWKIKKALDAGLELRCPDHPLYQAVRRPKCDCEKCEYLYRLKNG